MPLRVVEVQLDDIEEHRRRIEQRRNDLEGLVVGHGTSGLAPAVRPCGIALSEEDLNLVAALVHNAAAKCETTQLEDLLGISEVLGLAETMLACRATAEDRRRSGTWCTRG